jgi:hypothetical protein
VLTSVAHAPRREILGSKLKVSGAADAFIEADFSYHVSDWTLTAWQQ